MQGPAGGCRLSACAGRRTCHEKRPRHSRQSPMKKLLFTIASYAYMAPRLLATGDFEEGVIERRMFPDGERYLRIATDPWARDVVLLGGSPTDLDWLEIYDLGCAISRAGARSLSIVMPYFG